MPLRDILRKKDKVKREDNSFTPISPPPSGGLQPPPEFRFVRTDTYTQETIQPPSIPGDSKSNIINDEVTSPRRISFSRLRRPSNASNYDPSSRELSPAGEKSGGGGGLSTRLHIGRTSRAASTSSVNLPENLPTIALDVGDSQEREAQWEKRATMLAQGGINMRPSSRQSRSPSVVGVNDNAGDINIQEAIRLHEHGDLSRSTEMFGRLADPNGPNNALSQVLYGLALRHGWGCTPEPERAITYLSAAASNSALVENEALQAGMKKGGAAKGELVLAIFELANCFRHGWGVAKDPVAARQYYETAANLGDTDAMNEAGWCFLEGFGGKKDRYTAARYYRLAEENGSKTLGNSWIWKDKYSPK